MIGIKFSLNLCLSPVARIMQRHIQFFAGYKFQQDSLTIFCRFNTSFQSSNNIIRVSNSFSISTKSFGHFSIIPADISGAVFLPTNFGCCIWATVCWVAASCSGTNRSEASSRWGPFVTWVCVQGSSNVSGSWRSHWFIVGSDTGMVFFLQTWLYVSPLSGMQ